MNRAPMNFLESLHLGKSEKALDVVVLQSFYLFDIN